MRKAALLASWGYLILVLAAWLMIFFYGERWWPATMVLFGPRWIAALPLAVLLPLAAWRNRRLFFPLVFGAIVVFGPFMELCLPFRKVQCPGGPLLRVLSCNLNSGDFNALALASLIQDKRADIVALQECPRDIRLSLLPPGWQIVQEGELAVFSRYPLRPGNSLQALHPPHHWPRTSLLYCVVQTPGGDVTFCTVHLPSPRYGLQNILDRTTFVSTSRRGLLNAETAHRWRTSQEMQRAVNALPPPVIVAGDFNMPADSAIYRKYWGDYINAFTTTGSGYGWTEWATVRAIKVGVRIDHVLTGEGLTPSFCETGTDVGSDHLPLIAHICRVPSMH